MSQTTTKEKDLTVGSPLKLIIAFAIPMILGNLLQQLYNFADTMIVGHFLGVEQLAGVGATGSVNFLIIGFCQGICAGFVIPVAQKFGAKDFEALRRFVANAFYLVVIFSVVVTVIVSILARQILLIMRTPENIIEYSHTYILTIFIAIPITLLYNFLAGLLRSVGDSNTPLKFLVIATVINLFLDYVFIAIIKLGIFGAALATVLAQLTSVILCYIVIMKKFSVLHVKGDEWKIKNAYIGKLLAMGIPMGLQYSITAIGSVILQTNVNILGSIAVAATTAAGKVNMLFIGTVDGLGAAMATYGGQNLGAGKIDRIHKGVKVALGMGFLFSVFSFITVFFLGKPMISLFLNEPIPEMMDMAYMHVLFNMGSMIFLTLVSVLRFLIQGVGFSGFAVLSGASEMIARTIAGLFLIPALGYLGACLASPLAWLLADIFLIPGYLYVCRRLENQLKLDSNYSKDV